LYSPEIKTAQFEVTLKLKNVYFLPFKVANSMFPRQLRFCQNFECLAVKFSIHFQLKNSNKHNLQLKKAQLCPAHNIFREFPVASTKALIKQQQLNFSYDFHKIIIN